MEATETTDRADEARGDQGGGARALLGRGAPVVAIVGGFVLVAAAMIYATRNGSDRQRRPAAAVTVGSPIAPPTLAPVPSPLPAGTVPGAAPSVQFLERAPAIFANAVSPHEDRGPCNGCHRIKPAPAAPAGFPVAMARAPALPAQAPAPAPPAVPSQPYGAAPGQQAAAPAVDAQTGASPRIWVAAPGSAATGIDRLPFQEGHWQGLEVISLTPGLARVLGVPRSLQGVVVDEVTMPADTLGFQAGDVIVEVGDVATPDIESFIGAADVVRDRRSVDIQVIRKGEERTLALVAERLGTANGETAPMIPPGARRPHGYLGPCTGCHRIGTKGNLPVDVGDVRALTAPPISAGQQRPHEDRGACSACHVIQ